MKYTFNGCCIQTVVVSFHAGIQAQPSDSPGFNPYPSQDFDDSTCSDAVSELGSFNGDTRSAVGVDADQSEIDNLLQNTLNTTATGILAANLTAMTPVDYEAAYSLAEDMTNQLRNDTAASGDQWAQLFSSINFTSIGEILTNISTPLDQDQLLTLGSQLAKTVDVTGVGYFLGNVTNIYDQRNYGSLLNQMLATVNMTQVGLIAEALPSVVTDFPMAGMILGNIIGNANFTEVGNAFNRYNAAYGTFLQGCVGDS